MAKHWSGQECPKTGTYGQYHDTDNSYAGSEYDRHVSKGDKFPPSKKQPPLPRKNKNIFRRSKLKALWGFFLYLPFT